MQNYKYFKVNIWYNKQAMHGQNQYQLCCDNAIYEYSLTQLNKCIQLLAQTCMRCHW